RSTNGSQCARLSLCQLRNALPLQFAGVWITFHEKGCALRGFIVTPASDIAPQIPRLKNAQPVSVFAGPCNGRFAVCVPFQVRQPSCRYSCGGWTGYVRSDYRRRTSLRLTPEFTGMSSMCGSRFSTLVRPSTTFFSERGTFA